MCEAWGSGLKKVGAHRFSRLLGLICVAWCGACAAPEVEQATASKNALRDADHEALLGVRRVSLERTEPSELDARSSPARIATLSWVHLPRSRDERFANAPGELARSGEVVGRYAPRLQVAAVGDSFRQWLR